MSERTDADLIRETLQRQTTTTASKARDALAALDRLVAERDRLAEARRQALAFITDAVEALGEDEAWLLANDPDNTWCRILAARDALAGTPL